jgi:hypothetical protein
MKSNGEVVIRVGRLTVVGGGALDSLRRAGRCRRASRLTQALFNKHGTTPAITPRLAGSAPYYIFTDRLKLPIVMGGLGYGAGAHAPNACMVVEPQAVLAHCGSRGDREVQRGLSLHDLLVLTPLTETRRLPADPGERKSTDDNDSDLPGIQSAIPLFWCTPDGCPLNRL